MRWKGERGTERVYVCMFEKERKRAARLQEEEMSACATEGSLKNQQVECGVNDSAVPGR